MQRPLRVRSREKHEVLDITAQVARVVRDAGVVEGVAGDGVG